jgi:hypothetical protein
MSVYDELYPDAAPMWFQREQAHAYLEHLCGGGRISTLEEVAAGACEDCGKEKRRYRYGAMNVCLRCAWQRRDTAIRRRAA